MKKLQSEVKAAAEKQQTNAQHRESEGERWQVSGAETDRERHLAEKGQSDPTTERKQPNSRRAHLKIHSYNMHQVIQLSLDT